MDIAEIKQGLTSKKDIEDYNSLIIKTYRIIDRAFLLSKGDALEACLKLTLLRDTYTLYSEVAVGSSIMLGGVSK